MSRFGGVRIDRTDVRRVLYGGHDGADPRREGGIVVPSLGNNLKNVVLKIVAGRHADDNVSSNGNAIRYAKSERSLRKNELLDTYVGTVARLHYVDRRYDDYDLGWYRLSKSSSGGWLLERETRPVEPLPAKGSCTRTCTRVHTRSQTRSSDAQ